MILVSREPALEGCRSWRAPQGPAHGPGLVTFVPVMWKRTPYGHYGKPGGGKSS